MRHAILLLLAAAACGNGAEVHGTVGGHGLEAKDADVHLLTDKTTGQSFGEVWIGSRDSLCGWLSGNLYINYTDLLVIQFAVVSDSGQLSAPTEPGPYAVAATTGNIARAQFFSIDCKLEVNKAAIGGKVAITGFERDDVQINSATGGFELDFGADGAFSGEFHAGRCGYMNPVFMQGNVCSPTH